MWSRLWNPMGKGKVEDMSSGLVSFGGLKTNGLLWRAEQESMLLRRNCCVPATGYTLYFISFSSFKSTYGIDRAPISWFIPLNDCNGWECIQAWQQSTTCNPGLSHGWQGGTYLSHPLRSPRACLCSKLHLGSQAGNMIQAVSERGCGHLNH